MQFRFITLPRNGGIWQNKTERLVFRLNLGTSKQYQSEIRHNAKPTGEGGGGNDVTKFYAGRRRPLVQPLTLLSTFFWQMVPPSHSLFRTLYPF